MTICLIAGAMQRRLAETTDLIILVLMSIQYKLSTKLEPITGFQKNIFDC